MKNRLLTAVLSGALLICSIAAGFAQRPETTAVSNAWSGQFSTPCPFTGAPTITLDLSCSNVFTGTLANGVNKFANPMGELTGAASTFQVQMTNPATGAAATLDFGTRFWARDGGRPLTSAAGWSSDPGKVNLLICTSMQAGPIICSVLPDVAPVAAVLALDGVSAIYNPKTLTQTFTLPVLTTKNENDVVNIALETNNNSSSPKIATVSSPHTSGWKQVGIVTVAGDASKALEVWAGQAATALTGEPIQVKMTDNDANFYSGVAFGVSGAYASAPVDTGSVVANPTYGKNTIINTTAGRTMAVEVYRLASLNGTAGGGFTTVMGANWLVVGIKNLNVPTANLDLAIGTGTGTNNGGIGYALR